MEMSSIFSFDRIIRIFPTGRGNIMIFGMTTFTFVHVV